MRLDRVEIDQLNAHVETISKEHGGFYIVVLPIEEESKFNGSILTNPDDTTVFNHGFHPFTDSEEKELMEKTIVKLLKYL